VTDESPAGTKTVKKPEPLTPQELDKYVPQQVVVVIQINKDRTFDVIPETFFVSKRFKGEVIWELEPKDSNHGFTVTFADRLSPFKDAVFSDANPNSGPVQDVPDPTYYYYTVKVTDKKAGQEHRSIKPKDPGGIVTG
jgi:hypothetical protein